MCVTCRNHKEGGLNVKGVFTVWLLIVSFMEKNHWSTQARSSPQTKLEKNSGSFIVPCISQLMRPGVMQVAGRKQSLLLFT